MGRGCCTLAGLDAPLGRGLQTDPKAEGQGEFPEKGAAALHPAWDGRGIAPGPFTPLPACQPQASLRLGFPEVRLPLCVLQVPDSTAPAAGRAVPSSSLLLPVLPASPMPAPSLPPHPVISLSAIGVYIGLTWDWLHSGGGPRPQPPP